jgi:hypothetical protein
MLKATSVGLPGLLYFAVPLQFCMGAMYLQGLEQIIPTKAPLSGKED